MKHATVYLLFALACANMSQAALPWAGAATASIQLPMTKDLASAYSNDCDFITQEVWIWFDSDDTLKALVAQERNSYTDLFVQVRVDTAASDDKPIAVITVCHKDNTKAEEFATTLALAFINRWPHIFDGMRDSLTMQRTQVQGNLIRDERDIHDAESNLRTNFASGEVANSSNAIQLSATDESRWRELDHLLDARIAAWHRFTVAMTGTPVIVTSAQHKQ